jgi:hypothetical protein
MANEAQPHQLRRARSPTTRPDANLDDVHRTLERVSGTHTMRASCDVRLAAARKHRLACRLLELDRARPAGLVGDDRVADVDDDRAVAREPTTGRQDRSRTADRNGQDREARFGRSEERAKQEGTQAGNGREPTLGEDHQRLAGTRGGDEAARVAGALLGRRALYELDPVGAGNTVVRVDVGFRGSV